jgi:large subunit ribosomal protein L18
MALTKKQKRFKIKRRIRKKISGTVKKPRMSVFRSNKHIYVQLIDDEQGTTLCSSSTRNKEVSDQTNPMKKSDQAELVGKQIAQLSKDKGINQVVFDRNGYRYHGRVRKLAEGARKEGLKF